MKIKLIKQCAVFTIMLAKLPRFLNLLFLFAVLFVIYTPIFPLFHDLLLSIFLSLGVFSILISGTFNFTEFHKLSGRYSWALTLLLIPILVTASAAFYFYNLSHLGPSKLADAVTPGSSYWSQLYENSTTEWSRPPEEKVRIHVARNLISSISTIITVIFTILSFLCLQFFWATFKEPKIKPFIITFLAGYFSLLLFAIIIFLFIGSAIASAGVFAR